MRTAHPVTRTHDTPKPLNCGHEPSPHGEHTTGTGHTADGRELCWECCNRDERDALRTAQHYSAYLTCTEGGTYALTTWPGGELAKVTAIWETSAGGFARGTTIYRFRAVDDDGQRWYGTSPGPGMYARMHRAR